MKIGSQVLLKYGLGLVKGVVIDVDMSFITLRVEYKKGQHFDIKVKNTSKDILRVDGVDTEAFLNNRYC